MFTRTMSLHRLIRPVALAAAVALMPVASIASAQTQAQVNEALRSNRSIENGLFTAALIAHIADTCDTLRGPGRASRVAFFLGLYRQARAMGFSRAQIENYVNDPAERARMQRLVHRHLERQGVSPTDPAAVCAFGRQEIEKRSPVGRRLSER